MAAAFIGNWPIVTYAGVSDQSSSQPVNAPGPITQAADQSNQPETTAPSKNDTDLHTRAATFAWLKNRNPWFTGMSCFVGDSLSPDVPAILGLTPAETEQLNAATKQTKHRLDELEIKIATAHLSPNGETLFVDVPSLSDEGSSLYADLFNTFSKVLGPERLKFFNEINGEGFDRNFDRFGLNAVTYEVPLEPTHDGDRLLYLCRRYYIDAEYGDGLTVGSKSRADIAIAYPVLAHFLTLQLGKLNPGEAATPIPDWLKNRRRLLNMPCFIGDSLDPELSITLTLTAAETEQIEAAARQTKRHLDDLAIGKATAQLTHDNKILIVVVPAMPIEGAACYASLLSTLAKVLGPERLKRFNEITGDGFDRNFNRFGLISITYELTLQPLTQGDKTVYFFKRSFLDPDSGNNSSEGTSTREEIEQHDPVLAHFFTVSPEK
jgi:hypothetical protein